jgi:ElaB/YqjD/DUF883 family membrane-anchored ribosome-binding protein
MSGQIQGTGAAAVGAHSKDAMQPREGGQPAGQGKSAGTEDSDGGSGAARKIADNAMDAASQAGASAAAMAKTVGQSASRAGEQVYQQGGRAGEYVTSLVRSDPLLALVGAGALGLTLGLLISRR